MRSRAILLAGAAAIAMHLLLAIAARHGAAGTQLATPFLLPLLAIPAFAAAAWLPRIHDQSGGWRCILAVGIILRLLFLLAEPHYSDDVYRYIWDGRVQLAGHSPYGLTPADSALDGVESGLPEAARVRARVNHPGVPTVYPPVMQILFALLAALDRPFLRALSWDPLFTWRFLLLASEVAIAFLIAGMLRRRGNDPRLALLYLWHPLPVVESAWSAHGDSIGVLALLAALAALETGRGVRAGICLGLAMGAKLLPAVFLPQFLRRLGWRTLPAIAVAMGAVALPYAGASASFVLAGLSVYADSWYHNDITFHLLGKLLNIDVENRFLSETQLLRKFIAAGYAAAAALLSWFQMNPDRAGLWLMGLFVVLTPVLHPWYLLWVLPFAILAGSRGWLLLTATVLLSHWSSVRWREYGVWEESTAVKLLEFFPALTLIFVEEIRRLRIAVGKIATHVSQ